MTDVQINIADTDRTEEELHDMLTELAESIEDDTLNINVPELHEDYQHPEWEKGEPCPECGCEQFSEAYVEYAQSYATGDGYTELGKNINSGPTTSIHCGNDDCFEVLYKHVPNDAL